MVDGLLPDENDESQLRLYVVLDDDIDNPLVTS